MANSLSTPRTHSDLDRLSCEIVVINGRDPQSRYRATCTDTATGIVLGSRLLPAGPRGAAPASPSATSSRDRRRLPLRVGRRRDRARTCRGRRVGSETCSGRAGAFGVAAAGVVRRAVAFESRLEAGIAAEVSL